MGVSTSSHFGAEAGALGACKSAFMARRPLLFHEPRCVGRELWRGVSEVDGRPHLAMPINKAVHKDSFGSTTETAATIKRNLKDEE